MSEENKRTKKLLLSTERCTGAPITALSCQSHLDDLSLWVKLRSWRERDQQERLEKRILLYALRTKENSTTAAG